MSTWCSARCSTASEAAPRGRGRLVAITILAATSVVGLATDLVGRDNVAGLGLILAIGAGFGLLSILALRRASMVPISPTTALRLSDVPKVFGHAPFRRYAVGTTIYFLPFLLALPYYQVLYQSVLVMSFTQIVLIGVLYQTIKILLVKRASRWIEHFGPRRMVVAAGPMYAALFALLSQSTPERLWPVYLGWSLAAVADAIYMVASQATLYSVVPQNGARSAYFAVSNLLTIGIFAIGAVAGEVVLAALAPLAGQPLGPIRLSEYQWMYLMCSVLMLGGSLGGLFYAGKEAFRRDPAVRESRARRRTAAVVGAAT